MIAGLELDLVEKNNIIVKLCNRLDKVNTNEQNAKAELQTIIKEKENNERNLNSIIKDFTIKNKENTDEINMYQRQSISSSNIEELKSSHSNAKVEMEN